MYQYCEVEDLDPHEVNDCFNPKGGIPSVGVLKTGHNITDFSNPTEVQAAITAGKLVIFDKVKASLPEASAVTGENIVGCGTENITDGFDWTLDVQDYHVNANNDKLIPQLNSGSFEGLIFFMCDQDAVRVVSQKITVVSTILIPATKREKQYYHHIFSWYTSAKEAIPVLYDAPAGIFYQN